MCEVLERGVKVYSIKFEKVTSTFTDIILK